MSHRSNRRIAFTTLGCKVNQADTDEWVRGFRDLGYEIVDFDDVADAYVVNTCTVTHVADRKSRQLLRQARRTSPAALVVAAGCYASVAPQELAKMAEVDLVVGGSEKDRLVEMVHDALEGADERPYETLAGDVHLAAGRTRGFVKISDGCNKFCAFCIVPYARGRERSVPFDVVVSRVDALARAGLREIVLTAVHMGTYGRDLGDGSTLRRLVERILSTTPVERLRLSSIEPEDFDDGLLDLWPNSRLCRHFHLALDSGCDATLQRMRRRYDTATYAALVDRIRRAVPDVAITTDVMVGFPGETEAEFAESYAFVQQMGFAGIHVFPYSARRHTVGSRLPNQVHPEAKRERTTAMLALAEQSASRFRAGLLGQHTRVLVESEVTLHDREATSAAGGVWEGLTDNYVRVFVQAPAGSAVSLSNTFAETLLQRPHPNGLWGEIVGFAPGEVKCSQPLAKSRRVPLRVLPTMN